MKLKDGLTVLLACGLTACSSGPSGDVGDSKTAESVPTSTASRAASPTATASSNEPSRQSLGRAVAVIHGGPPGPLALQGDTLAFPVADRSDSWNTVQVSRAGTARTVATSEWADGLINWVALSGDGWVAYVDQSHTQGDGFTDVLWRVWALDLRSDRRVLLSTNGDTADTFVPVVRGGGGYIFWSQAERDRSAREFAWTPSWDQPRTLLTFAQLTPGSETYSDGSLVYLGPNALGLPGHTTGGDCWRLPIDGGPPQALTHTALAMGCAASDDTLIWTQHLPDDDPRNDEVGEQPFTTWTLDLSASTDSSPTKVYEGVQSGLAPAAGDGFSAWATAARWFRLASSSTGEQVKVPRGISMAASGSRLAVAQQTGRDWTVVLHEAP